jgi:hypothetical protein
MDPAADPDAYAQAFQALVSLENERREHSERS